MKEKRRRYQISIFLTLFMHLIFFTFFLLLEKFVPKHNYGASQFTVSFLSEKLDLSQASNFEVDNFLLESVEKSTQNVVSHKKSDFNKKESLDSIYGQENFDSDLTESKKYVEPEFENLLTGTGRKISVDDKKWVEQNSSSGVKYEKKNLSEIKNQDSLEGEEKKKDSFLSASNKEWLESGSRLSANYSEASEDVSSNATSGTSLQVESNSIIDLKDFEKVRRKLAGGYPDLSGMDLAGRRYINAVVELKVDASGIIQSVKFIQSTGSNEIDQALRRELRYWKFERVSGNRFDLPRLRLYWRAEDEN